VGFPLKRVWMALWAAAAALNAGHLAGLFLTPPARTDLGSFLGSAAALAAGRDPYGADYLAMGGFGPNLNPPISLLLFAPLAGADPSSAFRVVLLLNVAMLGLLLALLWRAERRLEPLVWAAGAAAVDYALRLGQVYVLLALAGAGAWLLLRARRDLAAGVLLGALIAFKPNLAVWPLLLFAAGHRRPALWASATAGALWSVPLAAWGPAVYVRWLAAVAEWTNPGQLANTYNGGLSGVLVFFGLEGLAGPLGAALVLATAFWAWRQRPDPETAAGVGITVALLAAPLAWVGYTLLLFPFFVARAWNGRLRTAAVLLAMPTLPGMYATALLLVLIDALGISFRGAHWRMPVGRAASPDAVVP
jgi:hypothetical protein